MKRSIFAGALVLFGLSVTAMSCSSATSMCNLICDCEHCNDQEKVEACNQFETGQDVASAYDCSDQWEAYATCVEERGTCDEKEARFSTRNDMGDDKCQNESDDLNDCIDAASAHDGNAGNFN